MKIISVNADAQLMTLASSIGQSQQSWRGWYCVEIRLCDLDETLQHECLFWVRSLIGAYLKDADGRVYFCENSAIHILCRNVPEDVLHQAGQEICDLAYSESSVRVNYSFYDLYKQGGLYAQSVLDQHNMMSGLLGDNLTVSQNIPELMMQDEQSFAVPKINSKRTRVMLVEDDPVTRWMVRNTLKEECELFTAPTANKAFSLYMQQQPDLVFLDINLPDKSGYEVLSWIMRNDPGACVVMFSSNDGMDNITNALEYGASGFIGKPFLKCQLLDYIHGNA